MKFNNTYFILRHGEARSNKENFVSSWPEKRKNPLTKRGKKQIKKIIPKLKKKNIDLIFSSDLLRTKQTAEIIAKELKIKTKFDKRLRELKAGAFNGISVKNWREFFVKSERFVKRPPQGENWRDIEKRMVDFLKNIDKKYKNKNILIISHGDPLFLLRGAINKFSEKEILKNVNKLELNTGEFGELKQKTYQKLISPHT